MLLLDSAREPRDALFEELNAQLAAGAVGVLPTDTLYGLSCSAWHVEAVHRVNHLKGRAQPATIVPHENAWAREQVTAGKRDALEQMLSRHPGATVLVPFAEGSPSAPAAALTAGGLVAFRQPQHWLFEGRLAVPVITTSANRSGQPPLTTPEDIAAEFGADLDFMVVDGPHAGSASTLIFLDGEQPRFVER